MQLSSPAHGSSTDRIAIVDILRAVALFGIVINHAAMSFLAGPEPYPDFNQFGPLDRFVNDAAELLTFGKFFAIFSFLFGLSFAIQLDSAARKGSGFTGRFAWRLTILFVIGFVHSIFFSGDVLLIYAVLGLLLIACRKWKNRTLIITGLILVLNVPGLIFGLAFVSAPAPSVEQQQSNQQIQQRFEEQGRDQYRIKQSGTVAEIAQMNLTQSMLNKAIFMVFSGRLWITFGYFLLGVWAGRVFLFKDTPPNRDFFKRLLLWSSIPAAITSAIHLVHQPVPGEATLLNMLSYFAFTTQQATLAMVILSAVTLIYWRKPGLALFSKLAATGKMGLTVYLLQTVFGITLFFGIGFGLLGKIGVAASVACGIGFFLLEILFAQWWLQRFNMGPFEWLWRSLTYLKIQPNVRRPSSSAQPESA
jgi:uncharacterized protein